MPTPKKKKKNPEDPIKVAIVGGGCAALTTAYQLAYDPDQTFDITIYQMGWRLGGKGASGRNTDHTDPLQRGRIEEHGLHVWMGFYENAFRLIRDCYEKLPPKDRVSPFANWTEAFFPDPTVGVVNETATGSWSTWTAELPPTAGLPGDPMVGAENPFRLSSYVARSFALLRTLVRSVLTEPRPRAGSRGAKDRSLDKQKLEFSEVSPRLVVDKMTRLVRLGLLGTAAGVLEAMMILEVAVSSPLLRQDGTDSKLLQFLDAVADNTRRQLEDVVALDDEVRTKLDLIELVLATVVGILRDGLLSDPRGLDKINVFDCRAWLRRHGASDGACQSGFVNALYDMAFAQVQVDENDEPGIAAGQALRGAFRMFFTYRGSLFWKMRAGMGDTVFVPLYEVLKRKGVKFKFFHRLRDVKIEYAADDESYVSGLEFEVQATPKPPRRSPPADSLEWLAVEAGEYYPLDAKGRWPASPDRAQLNDRSPPETSFESGQPRPGSTTLNLAVTADFDFVVLGLSIEAVKTTCTQLIASDKRWDRMVHQVKTVATQALQIWTKESLEELGWPRGPATVAGIPKSAPFDTWADMTQVVPEEDWPADRRPRFVGYFCSAFNEEPLGKGKDEAERYRIDLRNPEEVKAAQALVAENAKHFVARDLPRVLSPKDPQPITPIGMYCAANLNPSDRYVLSRPGSLEYRISPLDDTYDNLTIAGDWTDCGFNEGCVEAAVMSGLLAAHALSGNPALEDIVGFDHP